MHIKTVVMRLKVYIYITKDAILILTLGSIKLSLTGKLEIGMTMKGMVKNPFGVSFLAFGNIMLKIGITAAVVPSLGMCNVIVYAHEMLYIYNILLHQYMYLYMLVKCCIYKILLHQYILVYACEMLYIYIILLHQYILVYAREMLYI